MSGVTGVLLSYGDPADNPFPPLPPSSSFTMTNVDVLMFSLSDWDSGYAPGLSLSFGGNVVIPWPSYFIPDTFNVPIASIEWGDPGGLVPPASPNPDYTDVFSAPDEYNYWGVSYGSALPVWAEYIPYSSSFPGQPVLTRAPGNGGMNFALASSGWTTQTEFGGLLEVEEVDGFGGPLTVQLTPYVGGVVQRASYASGNLINVGGTAGTPYSFVAYNYFFNVDSHTYRFKTYLEFDYNVATKTLSGTVHYEYYGV